MAGRETRNDHDRITRRQGTSVRPLALTLLLLAATALGQGAAAQSGQPGKKPQEPFTITADTLSYDREPEHIVLARLLLTLSLFGF
mgnify:CR=1 FL=1